MQTCINSWVGLGSAARSQSFIRFYLLSEDTRKLDRMSSALSIGRRQMGACSLRVFLSYSGPSGRRDMSLCISFWSWVQHAV